MNSRKKVLVNAYALSPTKGSEFSVGWNTVNLLAEKFTVYVLYGTSGNQMGDTIEIENLNAKNFSENIKFIKVHPNFLARNFNKLNSIGLWIFFSPALYFYQLDVYNLSKKLHKSIQFDIVHQLNPIGFREPGFLWLLDIPFVWGPVCGTYILPESLINWNDWKLALNLSLRNIIKWIYLKFSMRIKKAVERSDVIITVTKDDSNNFLKYFNRKTHILSENFIQNVTLNETIYEEKTIFKFVWIGRIDSRKNLILLLDSLIKLKEYKYNWSLDVVGDGILRNKMEKYVFLNGLDSKITFKGHLSRIKVNDILAQADLHVMTSLYEATSTVLFEAYQNAIPTISLNHCGMADVICEKCGFLVSIDVKNYDYLVLNFSSQLKNIMDNPEILMSKRSHLPNCLEKYTASSRILDFEKYYDEATINFNQKKPER